MTDHPVSDHQSPQDKVSQPNTFLFQECIHQKTLPCVNELLRTEVTLTDLVKIGNLGVMG